jgi:hypothetical protein
MKRAVKESRLLRRTTGDTIQDKDRCDREDDLYVDDERCVKDADAANFKETVRFIRLCDRRRVIPLRDVSLSGADDADTTEVVE